jgi:hypothetical protein
MTQTKQQNGLGCEWCGAKDSDINFYYRVEGVTPNLANGNYDTFVVCGECVDQSMEACSHIEYRFPMLAWLLIEEWANPRF